MLHDSGPIASGAGLSCGPAQNAIRKREVYPPCSCAAVRGRIEPRDHTLPAGSGGPVPMAQGETASCAAAKAARRHAWARLLPPDFAFVPFSDVLWRLDLLGRCGAWPASERSLIRDISSRI